MIGGQEEGEKREIADQGPPEGFHLGQDDSQNEAEDDDGQEVKQGDPIRAVEKLLLQDGVDHVGMDFQPGEDMVKRGDPDVIDAYGRCPNEDDLTSESVYRNPAVDHVCGRIVRKSLLGAPVVDQHPSFFVRGNEEVAQSYLFYAELGKA